MRQLLLLIGVELKEYLREPGIIFWAILFPILLALGLGMAFSGGGNQDRTVGFTCKTDCNTLPVSDGMQQKIGNEKVGFTTYEFVKTDWKKAVTMLKQGKIGLVIEDTGSELNYHFDPANPDAKLAYLQLSDFFNNESFSGDDIAILKQEGTRYVDFLVPGLLAMGIMMSCMWGISYSNVERRNKKLLRRMIATPMKKYNYVAAQLIGRIIMSAVEAALLVIVTMWVFDIKITGSYTALVLMFLAGNTLFAGLAWLLASRTSKPQIANGLINLVIMPMMILSGIYFSYHNFPDFMVTIIKFLPLTILADNVRSIFIEGAGLAQTFQGFLVLTITGIICLSLGIRVYKWY